tara:strand:- start:100 stop:450 length:351 start_codon:yes stop_codon:yes gene_type:complete
MKNYIAVVKTSNNKLDKYADFDSKSDADAHVEKHGGFVVENPGGHTDYWVVDASAKTVTFNKSASDAVAARQVIIKSIAILENEITPRRIREAILGTDSNWLKNKEAEIATERGKL